eukprot:708272_1
MQNITSKNLYSMSASATESKEEKCNDWKTHCKEVLHFMSAHKSAGTLRTDTFLFQSFELCKTLFERDDDVVVIDNHGDNELCDSYPVKIIIQKSFFQHVSAHNNKDLNHLFARARYARARCRFAIPVIFLPNNSCIARSATLSSSNELLLNKSTTAVYDTFVSNTNVNKMESGTNLDVLRDADIELLQRLNIKYIFDLMVEQTKKLGWKQYAVKVASSEKADKRNRYKDFKLNCIPYPGCELFVGFKDKKFNANKLFPEWNNPMHDAVLLLDHDDEIDINTNWWKYQEWDIIRLTQNYLRLLLDYIQLLFTKSFTAKKGGNNTGLLIHCISGWDRTPLFISLLRLSLWADGVIHCALNASEILYLTLSYDWFLFTHQLGHRISRGEHIFRFAFYFLQWITNQKYSLFYDAKQDMKANPSNAARKDKLMEVYALFNQVWSRVMDGNNPPKYGNNILDIDVGQVKNEINDTFQYLKSMLPASIVGDVNHEVKKGKPQENVYQQLMDMGFKHQISIQAAKRYPNNAEMALNYALKRHQKAEGLLSSCD